MTDYFVLKRAWSNWMQGQGMAERTIKTYADVVRNFIDAVQKSPVDVTEEDVLAYVAAHGANGSGRNTVIQGLRSFFGWMSDKGHMERNPATDLKAKKQPQRTPRCLTPEQLKLVLAAADDRDRRRGLALRLLYLSGMRVGSAAKIKPADVDLEAGLLHVRVAKGNRPYDAPISKPLRPVLRELLELHNPERGPYLLNAKDRTIWKWCKEAGLDADIPGVHPHLLRHSFATHLLRNGADIEEVRLLMNHQSLAVTQVYLSTTRDELRRAADRLAI